MEIHQMDVETAYLNGIIHEDIYMKIPKGLKNVPPNLVLKLEKALYGLKQSGNEWYAVLHDFLIENGFRRSDADWCIFVKGEGDDKIIIGVYVDDIILATKSITKLENTKKVLSSRFKMKDMNELS